MSVIDLELLLTDVLRKKILSLIVLEDWNEECGQCNHPTLLHKGGQCTRI